MRIAGPLVSCFVALGLAACANTTPSERNAVTGAVIGGIAGNIIGDGDEGSTALGAVVGAGAGWYLGCRQEGRCGNVDNRRQHLDQRSGRYYFHDPESGRYFYENGEPYP